MPRIQWIYMDFGNLLQYSCLENRKDRGTWQAKIYGVARVGHDLATRERETDRHIDRHGLLGSYKEGKRRWPMNTCDFNAWIYIYIYI